MTLKITPAPATSEVRISADPLNARNAVISARLKAPIIDDDEHGGSDWGLPAGTWHLAAADSSGATAFSKDVGIAANTVAFANVLWQNVPPGNEFSVTATFKPSGTSGANFVVTAAPGVNFTTAAQPTPTPTSNPSQAPAAADLTGAPIPLWALILLGLLGLAALRARGRRGPPPPDQYHSGMSVARRSTRIRRGLVSALILTRGTDRDARRGGSGR